MQILIVPVLDLTDMEDAHATVLDLDQNSESSNAFFAVYDGHGGTLAPISSSNRY